MKNTPRFLWVLLLLVAPPCSGELSEVQVKSAYVFNFIKFVEWPAATVKPGDKIRLCVIGNEGLLTSLSALNGRKVGEYELHIPPRHSGNDGLGACHVLYIGEQEQRRFIQIIKSLDDTSTLTISDIPDFAERGGSIGLLNRGNRMLFEVNLATTRKAGLRLSSQMLNLATNIFGK
jgi:hypothetical protein